MPLRPCLGCYTLTSKGSYCGNCKPKGPLPRKVVKAVLERDGFRCQLQYEGICRDAATCADHRIPRTQGGSDELSNLQAACSPCNEHKGGRLDSRPPWRRP